MPRKAKYYWDTSVFLAWIKNEVKPEGEMDGLAEIVEEIDTGRAILVTSVLTVTEIFEGNLDNEQQERLNATLKRPTTVPVNVDLRVSRKAQRLREHYKEHRLKTPDATHLASALLMKVDALHTFDPHLLRYDGNVMGENLRVCKPAGKQLSFRFPD